MDVRQRIRLLRGLSNFRKSSLLQDVAKAPLIVSRSRHCKIFAFDVDVRFNSIASTSSDSYASYVSHSHELEQLLDNGDRITASHFCHGWSITQLTGGYRYCADDVLCAHTAVSSSSTARRLLELGAGVGTISLLWLGQQQRPFQPSMCTLIEAQEVSVELCRYTLRSSGLESFVDIKKGDLRDTAVLSTLGAGFDIIVSNPPYLLKGIGALPKHSQKAHCRHELRGGILDFCKAAACQLAPGGRFILVHSALRVHEVQAVLRETGFFILRRLDIFFRQNVKSIVLVCCRSIDRDNEEMIVDNGSIHVQEMDGTVTPEYIKICKDLGL